MLLEDHINKFPDADYLDMHTGYVYLTSDYVRMKKFKLPYYDGVVVLDNNGNLIGLAKINESLIEFLN